MATVTHRVATASTLNVETYASGAFTPAAGEVLVAFVVASNTVAVGTMTGSTGLTFTRIGSALIAGGHTIYAFVSNAAATAVSQTVTFNCTGAVASGAIVAVSSVSGLTRVGASAILQFQTKTAGAPGTPGLTFPATTLTQSAVLGAVGNGVNPATMTPPSTWTESADVGFITPAIGLETCFKNSGHVSSTVTWGSATTTVYGAIVVEMDTSAAPAFPGLYPRAVPSVTAVARSSSW